MKVKYTHDTITHNTIAASIIVPEILKIFNPKSVIDIGCGIGTWLKVFKESGITDILGVDGSYVNPELLLLETKEFIENDLEKGFFLNRKFDLALCLEVAEHISIEASDIIVDSLTQLSDNIIFSAAIPNQGGDNHINEQWPKYWKQKFQNKGFYFYDIFRNKYWDNNSIEWWYRQNMFLISKIEFPDFKKEPILNYIHPELFEKKIFELNKYYKGDFSIYKGFTFFIKTMLNCIKKKK